MDTQQPETNTPAISPADFRRVLGHYPTGVCVITSVDDAGAPLGLVVGTFTSVSLDPPLVGFLPDKRSVSWAALRATGRFAVNVLGADQNGPCSALSGRMVEGENKFANVDWAPSASGLPKITGAIATIECAIEAVHDAGDHDFVLGRVLAMDLHHDGAPMLFHKGQFGQFAQR